MLSIPTNVPVQEEHNVTFLIHVTLIYHILRALFYLATLASAVCMLWPCVCLSVRPSVSPSNANDAVR